MRTRSQQASPGGFLSLDDSAPRRTRSTRNTSQPNAQSSSSTQTTTRPKSQGTTKKTTTSKVTKTQTRKAPQRATRKSTRKTENQTTDVSQHESRNNGERAQSASLDDKENLTNESQDPDSVTMADSTALSELKSSSLPRNASFSAPPNTVDPKWYQYQIDNTSISEPSLVGPTTAEWRESDALSLAEFTTDDLSEAPETDFTTTFAADSEQRMAAE
ncbi:hypothetical protein BDV36DRAFT_294826 [Aspergillus pseudocaelatus]|uniref:Uncharacterized protein n=1 Tax=Aspergillus pseudocaelatus TaxID=1825620 RepID=A0ABQ6WNU0_9EURO|nr:hypothetical protein BDV36DRAFT_294826 [Aspergillus pseudocaelatus]